MPPNFYTGPCAHFGVRILSQLEFRSRHSRQMHPFQIFVIDDHPLIREGMSRVIDLENDLQICEAMDGTRGAVDAVERSNCDLLLLDLSLGDGSGLELIKDLRAAQVSCPILVLSMHDEMLYAERVLRAGANGYLMKEAATDHVVQAIRTLLDGEIYLSEDMKRSMLQSLSGKSQGGGKISVGRLTDRELEIFELLGQGVQPQRIAETLHLSPKTVDSHRANMREKLGFSSSTELTCAAVRWVESGGRFPIADGDAN